MTFKFKRTSRLLEEIHLIECLHKSNNRIDKDIATQILPCCLQNKADTFGKQQVKTVDRCPTLSSRDGVRLGSRSLDPVHFLYETAAPERRAVFVYIFEKFFMILCTRCSVHCHSLVSCIRNLL